MCRKLAQHTTNSVSELQGELLYRTLSRGKSKQMGFGISQLSWLTAIAAFSGISQVAVQEMVCLVDGVKKSPRASTTPCPLFASAGLSAPHWRHSTLSNKSSSEKLPRAPKYPTADLWEWLLQTVSFIYLQWVSFMTWKISPNNYALPKRFQSHIQGASTDVLYCTVLTYCPELQVHSQNQETSSGLGV